MINKATFRTENQVRVSAKIILGFDVAEAKIHNMPAIILETKSESEDISLQKCADELIKNCDIAATKYKQVVGILYNGIETRVFKNNIEDTEVSATLQNKSFIKELNAHKSKVHILLKHCKG